jgi:hypothetical protein
MDVWYSKGDVDADMLCVPKVDAYQNLEKASLFGCRIESANAKVLPAVAGMEATLNRGRGVTTE